MLTKTRYEDGYDFTTLKTPNLHFEISERGAGIHFKVYNSNTTLRTFLNKEEIDELILTLQVVQASVHS